MKLKFLLPVATIASAAVIVTPLIASCSSKTVVLARGSWDYDKGQYVSKIEQAQGQVQDDNDATNLYFNNLVTNPSIYVDDELMSFNTDSNDELPVSAASITLNKINKNEKRISAKINITNKGNVLVLHRVITINNLVMTVHFDGNSWVFSDKSQTIDEEAMLEYFETDKKWSISIWTDGPLQNNNEDIINKTFKWNNFKDSTGTKLDSDFRNLIFNFIPFSSYHLASIPQPLPPA